MLNAFAKRNLKSALLAGAAVMTVSGLAPAQAQPTVEKVVVTGSRIPQKGLTSVSPISTITNVEAKLQGTSSAEQLLNNLPQVFADQGAEVTNGSSGTAQVNLRGLGPQRTLVLVNGRRLHPASITNSQSPIADIGSIPIALIDRIEVLTGGASAVYGADAVAGVVNFIMRRNFEGVEVGAQYTITDHNNDDQVMRGLVAERAVTNPSEFKLADEHVNDGRVIDMWGVMGVNSADNRGNVTMFAQYRHAQPIVQSDRDFSACAVASNFDGTFSCVGSSGTPAAGRFRSQDPGGSTTPFKMTASGTVVPFNGATDAFNFGPYQYLQRPDSRYLLGAMGHFELNSITEVYAELFFADVHTVSAIAPSGIFLGNGPVGGSHFVNCDNPFLNVGAAPNVFTRICGDTGLAPTANATVDIGRRFIEAGPRQDDLRHTSYRGVVGLKGELDTWSYDLTAQYGSTIASEAFLNDVVISRVNKALQVVDPDGAGPLGPTCKSVLDGSDLSCVPLNVFQTGQISAAALKYVSAPGMQEGETQEIVTTASLSGELGVTSPWAETPVAVAIGGEYRFERAVLITDSLFQTADLFGQGGSTPSVFGHFDVWEAFGEVSLPLVEDAPLAKSVEIQAGYRISDYDTSGITHTYKYGATWSPSDDLKVRGSFQRAVRAPNVVELFLPESLGLWSGTDPCADTVPLFTLAQCQRMGVSAAQYGTISQCPSAQCTANFGGNPALKVEESDTQSFGLVFTPTFFKGFTASVDYFDIFLDGAIGTTPQQTVLNRCGLDGVASACALIQRAAGSGILFGVGFVESVNENTGSLSTRGVDFEAQYRLDLDQLDMGAGSLSFQFVGTKVFELNTQPIAGEHITDYDCVGLFGVVCGTPTFKWRHSLRTTWRSPWDFELSLAWRHLGEVKLDVNTSNPTFDSTCGGPCGDLSEAVIPTYDYLDIAFMWGLTDEIALRGGINNVFDKDPPVLDSNGIGASGPAFGNANTFPVVYDSLGREVFIAMTTRF